MNERNLFTNARIVAKGADPDAYHAQTVERGDIAFVISKSQLIEIWRCPLRWREGYELEASKAKDDGSLVDCLLLTPTQFHERYAVVPHEYQDQKTGEMKPWNFNATVCKKWKDDNAEREPVKHDALGEAQAAVKKLRNHPVIHRILDGASTQVWVEGDYKDRATGLTIHCKALLDVVPAANGPHGKLLADLKRARSAAPRVWGRQVFQLGYDMQAAFHGDLYRAATGEDRTDWGHIVQENFAPNHIELFLLSSEYVERGRGQYLEALQLYCQCLKTGQWPGYEARVVVDGFQIVEPEPWMLTTGGGREFWAEAENKPTEIEDIHA